MKKRKILSALCAVVLGMASVSTLTFANSLEVKAETSVSDSEQIAEKWNNNITYTIKDGIMKFSGNGSMSGREGLPFNYSSYVKEIIIEDGITSISEGAFGEFENLTKVTIPDSVTSIGNYAFQYCTSLTELNIPNSVTFIGEGAFSVCNSLTTINIPDKVTSIAEFTFDNCKSLTKITIPDSVTSIGSRAFADCSSLTEIVIPESVNNISTNAFCDSTSLTKITIKNRNCTIGDNMFTIYRQATIFGYTDSTAYDYAVKYSRRFVDLETNSIKSAISGDVNGDDKVDSRDAVVVLKDYASQILGNKTTLDLSTADMNDDGKINSSDAVIILKQYAQSLISK